MYAKRKVLLVLARDLLAYDGNLYNVLPPNLEMNAIEAMFAYSTTVATPSLRPTKEEATTQIEQSSG